MNAEHARAELLLPWFVNGTLDESELDLVNTHLEHCADCRRAVELEMDLAQKISAPIETPGPNFEVVRVQLRGVRQHRRQARRWRAGAAATASILILVASLFLLVPEQDEYQGLTSTPGSAAGPIVQLVFAPQTTERELRTLLLESGGQVIDGPSPRGVYRISLPTEADAMATATRLAAHPAVLFAEAENP